MCIFHIQVAAPIAWQRSRVWPLPLPFHLINAATAIGTGSAIFALNLRAPALAFLRDCQARTGSGTTCLLPAAALFEVAAAAAHMLLDGQPAQSIQLADCSVQSAMTLPDLASAMAGPQLCTVNAATGTACITSGSADHFTAQAAVCAVPATVTRARQSTGGVINRTVQHAVAELTGQVFSAAAAVATVCYPPQQPTSGYLTHPAAAEAATLLQAAVSSTRAPHTAAVFCQAYVASCMPQLQQGFCISSSLDTTFPISKRRSAVDITCRQAEASSLAFSGLVMATRQLHGSRQAADSPALQLMWQPIASEPAAPIRPRPQKWLILSNRPCALQDLCTDADATVVAVTVVYTKTVVTGTADIVVSCDAELQLVLAEAQADHCFLVQQRPDHDTWGDMAAESLAESASMLWAFRAFRRAQPRAKLSLVTWDSQAIGPYEAAATPESLMALGALPTSV